MSTGGRCVPGDDAHHPGDTDADPVAREVALLWLSGPTGSPGLGVAGDSCCPAMPLVATNGCRRSPAALPDRDVARITEELRLLTRSPEPAFMFSQVAAVCVPAICGSCVIDVTEGSNLAYRIRRSGPSIGGPVPAVAHDDADQSNSESRVIRRFIITGTRTGVPEHRFGGTMSCSWDDGNRPTLADHGLIELILNYACAVIESERLILPDRPWPIGDGVASLSIVDPQRRVAQMAATLTAVHHNSRRSRLAIE